jgi:hypothetical protein
MIKASYLFIFDIKNHLPVILHPHPDKFKFIKRGQSECGLVLP